MLNKMKNLFVEEKGQGMTEYGLVLGIIAVGAIAALVLLRDQISALVQGVTDRLTNETTTTTP
ncbi:Flp family type IVb pilin [Oceanirhabdus seepicola]|uniref:Flp family type IVb pilin n=1 Tax=Oceanirhabdus seepicola TaxID=2828781 RepID=A0A9J6NYH9_9CLOT|nr:Flp family type IVb pilin [Oceanirhabdus seepicola]MCM1988192.1 Flp family type IVb pilin [Oceanirhabdus seepicola]